MSPPDSGSSSACFSSAAYNSSDQFHIVSDDSGVNFNTGMDMCAQITNISTSVISLPATISSQQEYDVALALILKQARPSETYIGLRHLADNNHVNITLSPENFIWLDGSNLTFGRGTEIFPWAADQPNLLFTESACVEIDVQTKEWNDTPCTDLRKFMLCRSICLDLISSDSKKQSLQKYVVILMPICVIVAFAAPWILVALRRRRVRTKCSDLDPFKGGFTDIEVIRKNSKDTFGGDMKHENNLPVAKGIKPDMKAIRYRFDNYTMRFSKRTDRKSAELDSLENVFADSSFASL